MGLKANLNLLSKTVLPKLKYIPPKAEIKFLKCPVGELVADSVEISGSGIKTIENISNKTTRPVVNARMAQMNAHFVNSGKEFRTNIPENYVQVIKKNVQERKIFPTFGPNKGKELIIPAHEENVTVLLPHYYVDSLVTKGKGSGTKSIQSVVRQSLEDPKTDGRVMLFACCVDRKTSPVGFYYKLGFRFSNKKHNDICQKWLEQGGKREDSPFIADTMFLPKENIEHCLKYHSS